jgi:hypothetical protein
MSKVSTSADLSSFCDFWNCASVSGALQSLFVYLQFLNSIVSLWICLSRSLILCLYFRLSNSFSLLLSTGTLQSLFSFLSLWNSSISSVFIFSYLGSYGCTAKKTRASAVPVSVALRYLRYMLQEAGYQRSFLLVAGGTLPQKHALRNISRYGHGSQGMGLFGEETVVTTS